MQVFYGEYPYPLKEVYYTISMLPVDPWTQPSVRHGPFTPEEVSQFLKDCNRPDDCIIGQHLASTGHITTTIRGYEWL